METIDIILKSLILIAFVICAIGLYKVSATMHDYLWYVETNKDKDKGVYTDGLWGKIFDEENNKDRYVTIFDEAHNRVKQLENENKELRELNKKYIKDQFTLKNKMLSIYGSVSSIEKSLNATPKDIEGAYISINYIKQATGAYRKDNANHIDCVIDSNTSQSVASTVADCMNLSNAMDRIRELEKENENIRNAKAEYIKALEDKVYGGNYKCGSLKEQLPYPCNVLKAVTYCAQIAQELKEMAKEKRKEKTLNEKTTEFIQKKLYKLKKTVILPTGTIHDGVIKTEDEWNAKFDMHYGSCEIKTDWFESVK